MQTTDLNNKTDFIQTTRIKIPYELFNNDPHMAIKELLGQNIIILSYVNNDIITDDECSIVDVKYTSIRFNPFDIYYIKSSEVKQLLPNGNTYGFVLNDCNVKLLLPNKSDFKSIIPVKIEASIPNNYSQSGQLNQTFQYFAITVKEPMNSLITPLKYPNTFFTPFKLQLPKKLYPEEYKFKYISEDETLAAYKLELINFSLFQQVDNIVLVHSFKECKSEQATSTAFVIDFNEIPRNEFIYGLIAIQPNRIPNYVLYYPTHNYYLSIETLESINNFIKFDEIQYKNYNYVMNELNK